MKIFDQNLSLAMLLFGMSILLASVTTAAADDGQGERKDNVRDKSAELSVAPLDHVTFPADRPQWVTDADDAKPYTRVDEHTIVVVTRLCDTPQQCQELMAVSAKVAADAYAIDLVDFIPTEDFYEFSDDEINDLITNRYSGTAQQGDMTVYEQAVELTFTPSKRRQIKRKSNNVEIEHRLTDLAGMGLLGLVTLFGSSAVIGMAGRVRRKKSDF